jgi:hypothetical protein
LNFESYSDFVAFVKVFCFSDTRFDGHNVAAIFGKQGSLPLGFTDPNMYRDHSPAIRHESYDGFQAAGQLRGNGNEEPWGGAIPEPNLAIELDVHWHSISNAGRLAFGHVVLTGSGGPQLVFLFSHQPSAYVWPMVIMEMVKKLTSGEASILHPHEVVRWFDPFDPDFIG